MTKNEQKLITKAHKLFSALERVGTWGGNGGRRAEAAHAARDKALAEWEALVAELQETSP